MNELGSDRSHLVEPAHTQLNISQQCTLLSIPRSSYYYQPVGESVQNLALMERIDKLFMARPEMGVRRMHQELTTEDEPLNIKRIRRLMRLMGLEAVGPKPNLSKPQPGHTIYPYLLRGVSVERVNQRGRPCGLVDRPGGPVASRMYRWQLVFCIYRGRPCGAVIDWCSRFILSWRLSNTLLADFCVDALQEALTKWVSQRFSTARAAPTDQGSQFTSHSFINPLIDSDIKISMERPGAPVKRACLRQHFHRTVLANHQIRTIRRCGIFTYGPTQMGESCMKG